MTEVIWYLAFFMSIVFRGYHILNGTGSNWSVLYCGGGTAENGGNLSIRSAGPSLLLCDPLIVLRRADSSINQFNDELLIATSSKYLI